MYKSDHKHTKMDGNPLDGPDAFALSRARRQGWPAMALEQDKKTAFWMGGIMECFSTVLSLFNKADTKTVKDDWEVPFADLSEFMYLGAGAQGIVFRCRMKGEYVAVKKLREKNETNIKHLRKLDHKNLVRFRGVSVNSPIPCIIMEYCQHGPLFEYIHRGASISASQTYEWARDIALGMAYLHGNKIIHRDLKSPNILIAENFRVKVSDFGTAREWDDVSAIMSFTGTVAWMAPEVIRHEPCSERVDVWSYGVVLWELLTQEIPYKSLETHAIMWGVGTDTLSLPIPTTCPANLQTLLNLCWSRIPRLRPPFTIIAAHVEGIGGALGLLEVKEPSTLPEGPSFKTIAANLEIAGDQFLYHDEIFAISQNNWRREVSDVRYVRSSPESECAPPPDLIQDRREDMRNVRDIRLVYEQQLNRANELYMEVCAVRLQLEQREKDVTERENALKVCRCGIRKNLKHLHQQTSSSSDNMKVEAKKTDRVRKQGTPARVVVNYIDKKETTMSIAVPDNEVNEVMIDVGCACNDVESINNNNLSTVKLKTPKLMEAIQMKELILEQNGNMIKKAAKKLSVNANFIPPVAHV